MKELETKFEKELIKKCETAKSETDYNPVRFLQTLSKHGGVKTAKEIIRKGGASEGFNKLQAARRLDLTMEASVIDIKYAQLFTDDEVNFCYEILCECPEFRGTF